MLLLFQYLKKEYESHAFYLISDDIKGNPKKRILTLFYIHCDPDVVSSLKRFCNISRV